MKKTMFMGLAVALAMALSFGMAFAGNLEGGGTLSGPHYNLNLLGKDKCPGDDMKGGSRHTIFVLLHYSDPDPDATLGTVDYFAGIDKRNKIFLTVGEFQVIDGNACDNDGATFQLPANGADGTYGIAYEVFIRELAKPGKEEQPAEGDIRTCAVNDGVDGIPNNADDEVVCSTENVLLARTTGKSVFRNVTKELTTLLIDSDLDGQIDDRISLFDDDFYRYYWDYDNNGLRLVQLRFYPIQ